MHNVRSFIAGAPMFTTQKHPCGHVPPKRFAGETPRGKLLTQRALLPTRAGCQHPVEGRVSAAAVTRVCVCLRRGLAAIRVLTLVLPLGLAAPGARALPAAVPTVPAGPSTPGVPAVPSAGSGLSPDTPAIPGYAPGEGGLPALPGGGGDVPQMELIPPGQTPLQPVPLLPNLNLGASGPLVAAPAQNVDVKALHYKISKFTIRYGPTKNPPHPGLPPVQTLADKPIILGENNEAERSYVAAGTGVRDVPVVLSKFKTAETFSGDALQTISMGLTGVLNKAGIYGVFVFPDPDQINASTGEDLRKGDTGLTLLVYATEVKQVRVIVKPVPKPPFKGVATTVADPKYRKIAVDSPLQPAQPGQPGSLLRRLALQEYLDRINRFPGRRVDVSVSASGGEAGVVLDYIVHAEKPAIFVFDQTSNTGTQASGTWRTRAGLELRQLAGLDDLLDVSFETSLSSATYSVFGSYQVAAIFPDKLKIKAYGGYGKFLAEDVGFDLAAFRGSSATAGLLAIYTPYYFKGYPIDLLAGAEFKYVDISDVRGGQEGQTNFLLPLVGISTDKATDLYTAFANFQIQTNLPDVAGTDNAQLQNMGRLDVDRDFVIGRYSLGGSFFLEPLLFPGSWKAFENETDADKRKPYWKKVTTAHELSFLLHGQYTFDDKRLIPQFEDVIGGFVSVRGYPEAYTAGDDSFVFNAEYRFHLPRVLKPADTNQPADAAPPKAAKFALRPPTILGRPDVDFILRAFYDLGYVKNNNLQQSLEANRFLTSVGVGAEVQLSRYLNLRLDWGFPLNAVDDQKTSRPVTVGSSRISFVGVISY